MADDVIAWKIGEEWEFREVREADAMSVRLKEGSPPDKPTDVYQAFPIEKVDNKIIFKAGYKAAAYKSEKDFKLISDGDRTERESILESFNW